jgi:Spy/CpxP family protein refolding chaperone
MFQRLLFTACLLAAPVAWAAPADDGPPRRGEFMAKFIERMEKELDLTPTQTAQVREILKPDTLVEPPRFEGHGFPLAEEFVDQLRAPQVDTASLNRRFEQRLALQRERQARALFKFQQLHGVLTMEQRHKLADFLQKRLDRAEAVHEKQNKNQDKKKK